jgi:hypothetical protein
MTHNEFAIGRAFTNGHFLWRCTDIRTRTVVAIQIDHAEVVSIATRGGRCGPETQAVVDPRRYHSWLNGPPYALAEMVFDEYDLSSLRPVAEEDVVGWRPKPRLIP